VSHPDDLPRGHRHRFDPAALLAGLLFVSVAVWFGAAALAGYRVLILVAVPTLLFGFAVIGFVRVATRARRR
jgi:hypothetical protein